MLDVGSGALVGGGAYARSAPELFDIFSTNCDKRETSPRWSPAKTDGELLFRLAIRLFKPLMCVVFFIFIFKITLHS